MCFGGSQPTYQQPLPPQPSTNAQEALQRVQTEKQRAIAAQGLGATILTGGLGATDYGAAGKDTTKLGQSAQT